MAPKEPTRAQLSSKLSYQQKTPAFLLRLQNKIAGVPDEEEEDEEFEHDGSGRPPIPKRPAIPERPDEDPGSADEDDGDEKPQVVVLREGKHLSEREVQNIKRQDKGLAPLPDPEDIVAKLKLPEPSKDTPSGSKTQPQGLSFSSGKASSKSSKRKAVGQPEDDKDEPKDKKLGKKKPKKASKTLLSFGDDA
ncbi:hypothetical protein BDQ12DRAFT_687974 [Crucibulum laeve]|uniref:DUF4604 domain-containing protein n=1 Tax=Crucibulum laeve TaxID=68775 RepID=A0A5C3LRX8_9AGAR|nr:hypothetical protein BDQ12DRAFT_687974 [Crucibulum laeve]